MTVGARRSLLTTRRLIHPLALSPTLFFDLSDGSTLFQERTGGSATTPSVVGDPIGSIQNQGSVGGWATAPSDSARATRQAGYGDFDGSDDGYDFNWSTTNGQQWYVAAIRMIAGITFARVISFALNASSNDNSTANGVAPILRNATNSQICSFYNSSARATTSMTIGADNVVDVQFNGLSGELLGVNRGAQTSASYTYGPNFTVGRLGQAFEASGARGSYFQGRIYALAAGTGVLSPDQRVGVVNWMASRAGLVI